MLLLLSGTIQAEEKRHHGAHVHGVARLNIAVEGNNIYIAFSSPAANVVGFEHHPRTDGQKKAVTDALSKLQAGETLFLLSAESESRLVDAEVDTDIHEGADHHAESGHAGAGKGHHGQEEHHDHSKAHGEANEHERHSDFRANYHFISQKTDRLSQIDVLKKFGIDIASVMARRKDGIQFMFQDRYVLIKRTPKRFVLSSFHKSTRQELEFAFVIQ